MEKLPYYKCYKTNLKPETVEVKIMNQSTETVEVKMNKKFEAIRLSDALKSLKDTMAKVKVKIDDLEQSNNLKWSWK